MSILTDLEAALEGKREAAALVETRRLQSSRSCSPAFVNRRESLLAHYRLHALLTDDTIATLIAVVDEVTRRAPILVADPENDRLLNLAAALTRAPLVKEADSE
jgi:hypothetical protein